MIDLPRPAVALTQRQLGIVARFQLRRWLSGDQIDASVQRRQLIRLERGIYRLRGSPLVAGQRAIAAALRARPPATITGPVVLGFHGVDGFGADGPFEVLVPPGRRVTNVGFATRVDPRPGRSVSRRGAVRLTTPEDALVHSVRWRAEIGDRGLRLATHWLGWRGLLDRDGFLERLLARADVDADAASLLDVLGGAALGRCESDGERRLGELLLCFDPAPASQVWVTSGRRTDWYFRDLTFGLEYDGVVDHAGAADRTADARREAELARKGVELLRVTAADLVDVDDLLGRIVAALTRRAARLGVPAPRFDPTRRPG